MAPIVMQGLPWAVYRGETVRGGVWHMAVALCLSPEEDAFLLRHQTE